MRKDSNAEIPSTAMSEKRRTSARVRQEGPIAKRARLEKVETPKKSEAKAEKAAQPAATPAKVKNSKKSLPTVEHSQYAEQAEKRLKSIAESGVLAASLRQSRSKWLTDGILQRYWVKPAKKKDQTEIKNNPPKETMQKVGPCTIKVEPHVFEATLYLVRDAPSSHPTPKQPAQRPFLQYGPPGSGAFGYPAASTPPVSYPRYPAPSATPQTPHAPPASKGAPAATGTPAEGDSAPSVETAAHPANPQSTAQSKPSQDPVIQMLAARASTNPELKALMRVVASGEATHDQLRVFQSHIDDLNAILQRQLQTQPSANTTPAPSSAHQAPISAASAASAPSASPYPPFTKPAASPTAAPPKPAQPQNPHANSVVLELAGASGDRFLLPKHSILEAVPGRQEFLVSFLVVRSGATGEGPAYDAARDYYQPVTLRLATDYPRVFEAVYRAVAAPDEVRRWMDEVMARATRAEVVHLVMRVPEGEDGADPDVKPAKGTRGKKEDTDARCRFCFAVLNAASRAEPGGEACRACAALTVGRPGAAYNRFGAGLPELEEQRTAVQSLTLSAVVV